MEIAGWYNENQYRLWPFKDTVNGREFPKDIIVDMSIMVAGGDGNVVSCPGYLGSIVRLNNVWTFNFGCCGGSFTFTRTTTDKDFLTSWATQGISFDGCYAPTGLRAIMTTGEIAALERLLPVDGTYQLSGGIELDATVSRYIGNVGVLGLRCGNVNRLRHFPIANADYFPDEEPNFATLYPAGQRAVYFNGGCVSGDAEFYAGHSAAINISETTNSVKINADERSIEGVACGEIPLTAVEQAWADDLENSKWYLNSPYTCRNAMLSINGVTGRDVKIIGEKGVKTTMSMRPVHFEDDTIATMLDGHALVLEIAMDYIKEKECAVVKDYELELPSMNADGVGIFIPWFNSV